MRLSERLDKIESMLTAISDSISLYKKDVWNTKELALYVGLSEDRIRHLTCAREIPHYRQGSKVFFKRTEIEQWMLSKPVKTNDEIALEISTASYFKNRKIS